MKTYNQLRFKLKVTFRKIFIINAFLLIIVPLIYAQHNPGANCFNCHTYFKIGGTFFTDLTGLTIQSGASISLTKSDGNKITLDNSNSDGNIYSSLVPHGNYLIQLGNVTSRTWHNIPQQGACNTCHFVGGNSSSVRTKTFRNTHTTIPYGNDCRNCHHFPASMFLEQLMTLGVLNNTSSPPDNPNSQIKILGNTYSFDPNGHNITSVRQDIFAPGYFSMFDVILAVADKNNIPIEYYYDSSRMTHFITKIDTVAGDYWYHFSYDAGSGRANEIKFRRANRWDEALWRHGVWIDVVEGEDVNSIKSEYLEEINRKNTFGNMIPSVRISINASDYQGNPTGSGRITINRIFDSVFVTAHNYRSTGYPSPYPKPFQPGVITAFDVLLSLKDQGKLDLVSQVFYYHFNQNYIHSYYVVEMGFPGVGTAHSSGRQGFVYTTSNGTQGNLPNNADSKLHMTSDILVVHAQDFAMWRWIELGNPYYEQNEPTGLIDPLIDEDHNSISRGFNLHPPYPSPFSEEVNILFNIFETHDVNISIYNLNGKLVTTLYNDKVMDIGIHELKWKPGDISSGIYFVAMKYGDDIQVRRITFNSK